MATSPYIPLHSREIRVLTLLPGLIQDTLRGSLEHVTLPEPTGESRKGRLEFEAISYAWGDGVTVHDLDLLSHGIVHITQSLFEALRAFRYIDRPRHLWADAVCINQIDIGERNAQVAMMADVYSSCSRILVWLGDSTADDTLAFEAINLHEKLKPDPWDLYMKFSEETKNVLPDGPAGPAWNRDAALATFRLLERPWFQRLWVVQESYPGLETPLVFSCGSNSCPRTVFTNALYHIFKHWPEFSQCVDIGARVAEERIMQAVRHELTSHHPKHQLRAPRFRDFAVLDGLLQYSSRQCKDPRDRIFALRNILDIEHVEFLKPDYKMEVQEVYRRTICLCLTAQDQSRMLALHQALPLALVGTEEESERSSAISWVADLHHLTGASRAKGRLYSHLIAYNRYSTDDPARERYLRDHWYMCLSKFSIRYETSTPNFIEIRARHFATNIRVLTETALPPTDDTNSNRVDRLIQWLIHLAQLIKISCPEATSPEIAKFLSYPSYNDCFDWFQEEYDTKLRAFTKISELPKGTDTVSLIQGDEELGKDMEYLATHTFPDCLAGRVRLWEVRSVENNRVDLAWLPDTTIAGDAVYVFAYAPYPFVLRSGGEHMHLVGDGCTFATPLFEALGGIGGGAVEATVGANASRGDALFSNMLDCAVDVLDELVARLGWISIA